MFPSRLAFSGLLAWIACSALAAPLAKPPANSSMAPGRPVSTKPAKPERPPITDAMGAKLQAFLSAEGRKQVSPLEPWQTKLFDEEILPEYRRFIRDYRAIVKPGVPGGSEIEAEADVEGIRKFLRFYGPKSLKREAPPLLILLRAQANCEKCQTIAPEIKKVIEERVARRGMMPVWVTPQELSGTHASAKDKDLDEAVMSLASQRKATGALVIQWGLALNDEADSSHADEIRYVVHSYMNLRDLGKLEGQLEIMEAGSIERSASKLLTDAFAELGDKVDRMELSESELKRDEILVEVTGFESAMQYNQILEQLRIALKGSATVEEQKVARGRAVFAVLTETPLQKIHARLGSVQWEAGKLKTGALEGQGFRMEWTAAVAGKGSSP